MSTIAYGCPICNGLISLSILCPHCGETMEDHGRLLDMFAPYSPYRPIDDLKKRMDGSMRKTISAHMWFIVPNVTSRTR